MKISPSYVSLLFILIATIIIFFIMTREDYKSSSNSIIKYVDDVSQLQKTIVKDIIYVQSVDDIIDVIKTATKNNVKISMRGQKHSMGGHTIADMGYVLDMKYFNKITNIDIKNMTVTINPGVQWCELIKYLNKFGMSPMILQSYSTFSVGGSVSVNAHGVTSDDSLSESIVELKIINHSCEKIICARDTNYELFSLIVGGYGLFGVLYEITLKIVPNEILHLKTLKLNANNFDKEYQKILNDNNINIKLARIDVTTMRDINLYFLSRKQQDKKTISVLGEKPNEISYISKLLYKWILPLKSFQKMRYCVENTLNKPLDLPDISTRNSLLYESAEPLTKLYSPFVSLNKTHILQEYFIPIRNFVVWMDFLEKVFIFDNPANIMLINITIRFVKKDRTTFLKYANDDVYAFVLYFRISKNEISIKELKSISKKLINMSLGLDGTFYLPYLCDYSGRQLEKSYPNIRNFVELKMNYDPQELFSNKWFIYIKKILEIK